MIVSLMQHQGQVVIGGVHTGKGGLVSTCAVSVSPKEWAGVVSVRTAFSHGNRDPNTVTYTKLGVHFLT